jgi:hypothetical protein
LKSLVLVSLLLMSAVSKAEELSCPPAASDSIAFPDKENWSKPKLTALIQHCADGNAASLRIDGGISSPNFIFDVREVINSCVCSSGGISVLRLWSGTWSHLTGGFQPLRFRFNVRCANGTVKAGNDVVLDFTATLSLQNIRLLNCSNGGCGAIDGNG